MRYALISLIKTVFIVVNVICITRDPYAYIIRHLRQLLFDGRVFSPAVRLVYNRVRFYNIVHRFSTLTPVEDGAIRLLGPRRPYLQCLLQRCIGNWKSDAVVLLEGKYRKMAHPRVGKGMRFPCASAYTLTHSRVSSFKSVSNIPRAIISVNYLLRASRRLLMLRNVRYVRVVYRSFICLRANFS